MPISCRPKTPRFRLRLTGNIHSIWRPGDPLDVDRTVVRAEHALEVFDQAQLAQRLNEVSRLGLGSKLEVKSLNLHWRSSPLKGKRKASPVFYASVSTRPQMISGCTEIFTAGW